MSREEATCRFGAGETSGGGPCGVTIACPGTRWLLRAHKSQPIEMNTITVKTASPAVNQRIARGLKSWVSYFKSSVSAMNSTSLCQHRHMHRQQRHLPQLPEKKSEP